LKVLYLSHTSRISGAEHSLLELLGGLPADISPVLACPKGELADSARALGVPLRRVGAVEGSLKLHPLWTPRAVAEIVRTAAAVRRLARTERPDLVHANSIRAGLVASLAARSGGAPTLVHLRDHLPPGRVSSATLRLIGKWAAGVLANSRYTESRLPETALPPIVRVVDNPFDLTRFDPERMDPAEARARLGLDPSDRVLAVVAQITPWKGQDDAIRMLARLKQRDVAARLLIVGAAKFTLKSTRYDNPAYLRELHELSRSLGVGEEVAFLGERADVPEILRASDVALVPSWEEPFGRTVVEAMAMGTPVVATSVGGPSEILSEGREGRLLPPCRPELWAEVLEELLRSPDTRSAMGLAGRRTAVERFGVERAVDQVVAVYREALSPP